MSWMDTLASIHAARFDMPRLLKIRVERICDCLDRETQKFRAGE
jgi:hypothetical protein